jgi:chromosome segregation ATPase
MAVNNEQRGTTSRLRRPEEGTTNDDMCGIDVVRAGEGDRSAGNLFGGSEGEVADVSRDTEPEVAAFTLSEEQVFDREAAGIQKLAHRVKALQRELQSAQNDANELSAALSEGISNSEAAIRELSDKIGALQADLKSVRQSAEGLSFTEADSGEGALVEASRHQERGPRGSREARAPHGRQSAEASDLGEDVPEGAKEAARSWQGDDLRRMKSELAAAQGETRRLGDVLAQAVSSQMDTEGAIRKLAEEVARLKAELRSARGTAEALVMQRLSAPQGPVEEEEDDEAGGKPQSGPARRRESEGTRRLGDETQQLRSELSSARGEAAQLSAALEQAISKQKDDFQQLASLERAHVEALKAAGEASGALQELACEVSKLQNELCSAQNTADRLCNVETAAMDGQVHVTRNVKRYPERSSASEVIEELKNEIEHLRSELLSAEEAATNLRRTLNERACKEKAERDAEITALRGTINDLRSDQARDAQALKRSRKGLRQIQRALDSKIDLTRAFEDQGRAIRLLRKERHMQLRARDAEVLDVTLAIKDLNQRIEALEAAAPEKDRIIGDLEHTLAREIAAKKERFRRAAAVTGNLRGGFGAWRRLSSGRTERFARLLSQIGAPSTFGILRRPLADLIRRSAV